ncbi:MAG: DUF192 domain-containing protein [Deltaproteobacteria bacterium]|nr:MAG: DUF192 domain-containing protein [Deltaproteobacteria bacterium]
MLRLLPVVLLLAACGKKGLPVHTISVDGNPVKVELAATSKDREIGLMHRESMPADEGMLFIYNDERPRSFWMKNTLIPLDIAYLSKDGTIVKIAQMEPLSVERTQSLYPAKYALEMNVGWFEKHDVQNGDKVTDLPTDITVE